MCGIVGSLGKEDVAEHILEALKRLEYRGYDSAGIATIRNGGFDRRRAEGKLKNLARKLEENPLQGKSGIGHTRWATHGPPTERNAHPHQTDRVALVHNGIIENFKALRAELQDKGHAFDTETDTEVVAYLITDFLNEGKSPREAVHATLQRLNGAFALAILIHGEENLMYGARRGSPLVVGYGDGEMHLGSDAIALAPLTSRLTYLEEGDWVELTREGAAVFDEKGNEVERQEISVAASAGLIDKGNYRHYMQKEIFEQPTVVGQTLGSYLDPLDGKVRLPDLPFDFAKLKRMTIVACGTSYYAGMVAKYWIEQLARIPVDVDIASEFRYRTPVLDQPGLALFISQSGETADTMAALKHAREEGQHIAAVVNVPQSSMAREADLVLETHAGPEIGVASTKAFTCQLAVLLSFAIAAGYAKGTLDEDKTADLVAALGEVPARMSDILKHDDAIEALAHDMSQARDVLYLGRGSLYPLALEGALKLKEISYIHAEGYASGEMKHGPIALIDDKVPVVVLAAKDDLYDKSISNMQEVIARDGRVVMIGPAEAIDEHGSEVSASIRVPHAHSMINPLIYALPVQLLAYHVAVHKGTDVDQPRNLAKSVTVE